MIGSGAGIGGGIGSGAAVCNPGSFAQDYYSPAVPFYAPVSGFIPPQKIRIVGTPICGGSRFAINLKSPHDIVFHFNPRFDQNVVVRNSTHHGNWQNEERYEFSFPFKHDHIFTLELIAGGGQYIVRIYSLDIFIILIFPVTIDGQAFTSFTARDDPQHITELEINGDVTLHSVHVGF